jgi:uncharacterized protein YndB with AHSA1/START domain
MERKNLMDQTRQKTHEVTISRVFNAPVETVWKMWSDPELIKRWWGPKDFTSPFCQIDFRVGGKYLFDMKESAELGGRDVYSTGIFKKIDPYKEILYTDSFSDVKGNVVPASYYGIPDEIPLVLTVTLRFEDLAGKTRMTLTHEGLPAGEMSDGTEIGWGESMDKFEAVLASLK